MCDPPLLPNLDNMPSVMEVAEVNAVLAQIVAAARNNPTISSKVAADLMVDAIFAQGYRPDECLDDQLSEQIFRWIQAEWASGDEEFAKSAITVLANLNCNGITQYFRKLLETDQRPSVQVEIRKCTCEFGD
jgi:hypothetical protein